MVNGNLANSTTAPDFARNTASLSDSAEKVFLVNNDDIKEEICGCDKVYCYDGPLDVFGERHVFPENVSFAALQILLKENRIVLIDVRNTTELETTGKIPGSHNVPLPDIPEAFLLPSKEFEAKYGFPIPRKEAKNTVLTCRSGRRVLTAKERLEPLGYTKLRLYPGSFLGWVENGGEVEPVDHAISSQ